MAHFDSIEGILLPQDTSIYLEMCISDLYDTHISFRMFEGIALVVASLEYARHHRNDTPNERLEYIWEKAYYYSFNEKAKFLPKFEYNQSTEEWIITNNNSSPDDLPF